MIFPLWPDLSVAATEPIERDVAKRSLKGGVMQQ